jgi:protein TorT
MHLGFTHLDWNCMHTAHSDITPHRVGVGLPRRMVRAAGAVCLGASLYTGAWAAEAFSIKVDVWDPPFNKIQKHSVQPYQGLPKAVQKWRLCVVIPHLKDPYWLAVNYGLIDEATRLGVALTIKEAGGYENLAVQRKQIDDCGKEGAQALIVGSISSDGLKDLVTRNVAEGRPVIDLINGMDAPDLTARAAADFFELGRLTGKWLLKDAAGRKPKVAWLPGPQGAGWSEAGDAGFRKTLGDKANIVQTLWGDTGMAKQLELVKAVLDSHPDVTYLVGTAVSAEAAVQELRRRRLEGKVKVVSYYFGPTVAREILRGNVQAAPTDVPTLQSRLAVDLAVRALEKKPYLRHVNAQPMLIDRNNIKNIDMRESLAPDGFRSVFSVNQ